MPKPGLISQSRAWKILGLFGFFFFLPCHHLAPVGLNAVIIYYFCKKEGAWEAECFLTPPGGLFFLALHENGQAVGSAG